jgi:hypothetical protein
VSYADDSARGGDRAGEERRPLRDSLIDILHDAIDQRSPDGFGCHWCTPDEMCPDHLADQIRTDAMWELLKKIELARDDPEVFAALREGAHLRPVPRFGRPAMTAGEIRVMLWDAATGRHWSHGRCWCNVVHEREAAGLRMLPPPWDAARRVRNVS